MNTVNLDEYLAELRNLAKRVDDVRDRVKNMEEIKRRKVKDVYLRGVEERLKKVLINITEKSELDEFRRNASKFIEDLEKVVLFPDIEEFIQSFKDWTSSYFNILPDTEMVSWIEDALKECETSEIESAKGVLNELRQISDSLRKISTQLAPLLKKDLDDLKEKERIHNYLMRWLKDTRDIFKRIVDYIRIVQESKDKVEKYEHISQKPFVDKYSEIIDYFYKRQIQIKIGLKDAEDYWRNVKESVGRHTPTFTTTLDSLRAMYDELLYDEKDSLVIDYINEKLKNIKNINELTAALSGVKNDIEKIREFERCIEEAKEKYIIDFETLNYTNTDIKRIKELLSKIQTLTSKKYGKLKEYEEDLKQDKQIVEQITKIFEKLKDKWTKEIERKKNRYRRLSEKPEVLGLLQQLDDELKKIKEPRNLKELVDSYKQAKEIIKKIEDEIDLSKDAEEILEKIDEIIEKGEKVDLLRLHEEILNNNKLISGLLELTEKGIIDIQIFR